MFTIPRDSEAFTRLQEIVADPNTYEIHVAVQQRQHPSGFIAQDAICIKRNQGMWSHPLSVKPNTAQLEVTR
jgi:hypothetical protein